MKREGRGGGAEWRSWGERREASQQARLWAEWHDLCFLNSLDLVCVQAFNSWLKSSCFFFFFFGCAIFGEGGGHEFASDFLAVGDRSRR